MAVCDVGSVATSLGILVVPPYVDGGGVEVATIGGEIETLARCEGDFGEDLHGASVMEAVEDTAYGVVIEGGEWYRLAKEKLGVLKLEEVLKLIKRGASREGVQNHADDGSARIKIHLRGDETIDDLVDAQFAAEGGDDWQVIGLANVDVFGNVSKLRLHGRQQSRH